MKKKDVDVHSYDEIMIITMFFYCTYNVALRVLNLKFTKNQKAKIFKLYKCNLRH